MSTHTELFDTRQSRQSFGLAWRVFAVTVLSAVLAASGICGELSIFFNASGSSSYYEASSSSLTWDSAREYLYLPYGVERKVFSNKYPTLAPVNPPRATAQMGCSLVVLEDCFVSGFARWSGSNGGNPLVRLWTNDTEEFISGINSPWADIAISNLSGWQERALDFALILYPLTAGNTYWLANVDDNVDGNQVGDAGSATSGSDYVAVAVKAGEAQRWYINNDETPPGSSGDPSGNLNIVPKLYGVPDLRLNRFESAGSLITKTIDLGATKVEISGFEASFLTSNSKIILDAVTKTGPMAYDISYTYIAALGRAPSCAASFSIAQSSDGVHFGAFQTTFATVIDKRYIKIRMELTTQHRGITPIMDSLDISYNCYPEVIVSTSVSPADGSLVTVSSPVFRWAPSYDHDGDNVTYTFSLSDRAAFNNIVFSTTAFSTPSSTYVVVNYPLELADKTTYYFRINAVDSNGAVTAYDRTYSFITELVPLSVSDTGIIDGSRVLASYVQNGFVIEFSKDINFSTFEDAFTFIDASSSTVSCVFSAPTPSSVLVLPTDTIVPCSSYSFSLGSSLRDSVGLYITDTVSVNFGTLNSKAVAYTSSVAGSSMTIIAGASPEDFFAYPANLPISLSENSDLLSANNSANSTAFIIALSSEAFSYSITNAQGANITSMSGVTLTLPYEEAALSVSLTVSALRQNSRRAQSESISVAPSLLRVFKLNEESYQWGLVPGVQTVDSVSRTVTAHPTSGGTFSVLAYPSNPAANVRLRNTPNPFFKGTETAITFYLSAAANVKAKIYTQLGHLIYEKEYAAGSPGAQAAVNSIAWDGKNSSGAYVASGIYLLRLEIDGEEARTRKIGFIR